MRVREEIVAVFPNYDQNRGIERAIPTTFDGRRVFDGKIEVWRNGSEESIADTESGDGVEVFRIGKSDVYVQGEQKFVNSDLINDIHSMNGIGLHDKEKNRIEQFFVQYKASLFKYETDLKRNIRFSTNLGKLSCEEMQQQMKELGVEMEIVPLV
jgi:hypothetical protein